MNMGSEDGMKQQINRHYHYIITLDTAMWPRKLAGEMMLRRDFYQHLVSVIDTQNATHVYGATYVVLGRRGKPADGRVTPVREEYTIKEVR
jgi:hypothetical protein